MPPRLYEVEAQPLTELNNKSDQAEGRQEVFHLLALWFLKADNIYVQVPYDDGVPPRNQFSASSISVRWSRVDRGRYAPMIGVHFPQETISHITTFSPWKRVD